MQAFSSAAAVLNPSSEDPAQLAVARGALSALLTTPQPLADKLAGLAALRAALGTLQAAGSSDAYVPDALAALADVRGVALDAEELSGVLRALQGNYTTAAPCVAALLQRAAAINSTVLVLPEELAQPVELLREAEVRREGISTVMQDCA